MARPVQIERRWRICPTTTLIPILFISTIVLAFWIIMGESSHPSIPTHSSHFVYSTVPGFFAQDDPSTNDKTFDFTTSNFGLLPRPYDTDSTLPQSNSTSQWSRFAYKFASMNKHAPASTTYRLLLLARHGQGYHNVAEAFFGFKAWNCFYSTLNGSPQTTWADAHLTPLGMRQAEDVSAFWAKQIAEQDMPTPERYYVSPLDRACRTAELTFRGLALGEESRFQPVVKEGLREGIGIHTCDRRSSREYIESAFPSFEIEEGFPEEDPLWGPELREPGSAQTVRLRGLLDDVFESDGATWISMTSHSGTIQSILRAVGHREFNVKTGGVIPVLVKVERVAGKRPEEKVDPWGPKPECAGGEPGEKEVEEALRKLDESIRITS